MAPHEPIPRSLNDLAQQQQNDASPSQTIPIHDIGSPVVVRQSTVTVVATDDDGGGNSTTSLSGGAIAGIVIGSVAGFLILLWIIRSCFNLGAPPDEREPWYRYVEPSEKRRHHHHHHRRPSHSRRRGRSRSSRRGSSSLSAPPPVVIDYSRSSRKPRQYYDEGEGRYYQTY